MKALRKFPALTLLTLASLLPGCISMSKVAYRPDPARPIRTIRVSRDVRLPEKMVFIGLSQNLLMGAGAGLGGAVGGALMGEGTIKRKTPSDYGLADSLATAFVAELKERSRFTVVTSGPADAELKIDVREYGFLQAGFMRRGVKPYMNIQAQLIRSDGKKVWEESGVIAQNRKTTPAQLPDQMKQNPDLTVQALRAGAQVLAAEMTASLR